MKQKSDDSEEDTFLVYLMVNKEFKMNDNRIWMKFPMVEFCLNYKQGPIDFKRPTIQLNLRNCILGMSYGPGMIYYQTLPMNIKYNF